MKFLLMLFLCISFTFGQSIAVIDNNFHVHFYILGADNNWHSWDFNIGLQATFCSFDESGELWLVGMHGQFFSTDCASWVNWHAPLPGGHSTDVSAHGRIIVSPDAGVCEYNKNTNTWTRLSTTWGGIARLEYVNDEEEEIYKQAGYPAWGGRFSLQSWDINNNNVYTYPRISMVIWDVTYIAGTPLVIAGTAPTHRNFYFFENGQWEWYDNLYDDLYKAVDATPSGDIVHALYYQGEGEIVYNMDEIIATLPGDIVDVAICDFNINP